MARSSAALLSGTPVSDAQYLAGARIMKTRLLEKALPSPATLQIVNKFVQDRRLSLVPVSVFEESLNNLLYKMARPPSKRHAGTRLRQLCPIPMIAPVFHHWMSIARGLPQHSPAENIERIVWGSMHPQRSQLIPIKETAVRRTYRVKLMRQDSIMACAALHLYKPAYAMRATRLLIKKKSGEREARARALCMLAGPFTVKLFEPIGKARETKLPQLQVKANVLSMDLTTAEVSFGTVEYPPMIKKWLRWEFYHSVESLVDKGHGEVLSDEFLELVSTKLLDTKWSKEPRWAELQ